MGKRKTRSSTVKAVAAASTETSSATEKPTRPKKRSKAAETKSKPNTEDKSVKAAETTSKPNTEDKSATSEPEEGTSTQDGNSSEERAKTSSPEPNCSICLGKLENKSFTDSCFHMFCFVCLLEWSKVKAVCPLCKQEFKSIIHNVRSFEDYDQYYLRAAAEAAPFGDVDGNRFRYRTTLTADRWLDRLQLQHRNEVHLLRRPSQRTTRFQWRRLRENSTSEFRQRVYAAGLRVREVQTAAGRPMRYRDISPNFFRANTACTHRLVPWLNRELNALLHGLEDRVQNALELIMDLIMRFDILSEDFYEHVQRYTGIHTAHFIHEFSSFARSPYDMASYDRYAIYDESDAAVQNIESSSNSSDDENSDIIFLSESENNEPLDLSGQAGGDHSYSSSNGNIPEPSTESHFLNADLTPLLTRVRNFLSSSIESRVPLDSAPTGAVSSSNIWSTISNFQMETMSPLYLAVPTSAPVFPSSSSVANEPLLTIAPVEPPSYAPNQTGVDASQLHSDSSSEVEIVGFEKPWDERSPVAVSSAEEVVEVVRKKEKKETKRSALPARYRVDRSRSSSSSSIVAQDSSDDYRSRRRHPSAPRCRSRSRSTGRGSHQDQQQRSRHRSSSRSRTDRYRSGHRDERRSSRSRDDRYRRSRSRTNTGSRSRTDRSSKNTYHRDASRSRSVDKHRRDHRTGQRYRSRSRSRDHRFGSSRSSGYGHQSNASHNSRSTHRSRRTRSKSISRRVSISPDRYSRKRRRKDSSSSIEFLCERRRRDRHHESKKSNYKKSRLRDRHDMDGDHARHRVDSGRHRNRDRLDPDSDHRRHRKDSDSSIEVRRRRRSRSPAKKTTQSQSKNDDATKKTKKRCKKNPTGHKNRPIKLEKMSPPPVAHDTVASTSETATVQSNSLGNVNTESSDNAAIPTQPSGNVNNQDSDDANRGNDMSRSRDTDRTINTGGECTGANVVPETVVSNSGNFINETIGTNMDNNVGGIIDNNNTENNVLKTRDHNAEKMSETVITNEENGINDNVATNVDEVNVGNVNVNSSNLNPKRVKANTNNICRKKKKVPTATLR